MRKARPPRVVAELGRPETTDETAARKAENSRKHRARQTINNLALSLLATLALVAVIVLLVPRSDKPLDRAVDYATVAVEAQRSTRGVLANPALPEGWRSNAAELRTGSADKIQAWYIGFLTPQDQFIGMTQAFDANPSWLAAQLENTLATGTTTVGGIRWTIYDNRDSPDDLGNVRYAMTSEAGSSTYALAGTADPAEFSALAEAIAPDIRESGKGGTQ
ncbi:DUF4245 domain-containing protein [Luethyella okanaganae]|uniref:DUF4245 domain-containing protein n=1 Tax=Luethyella okanaganae TaxID=69372 RepID=A0ABW1VB58_9MICO